MADTEGTRCRCTFGGMPTSRLPLLVLDQRLSVVPLSAVLLWCGLPADVLPGIMGFAKCLALSAALTALISYASYDARWRFEHLSIPGAEDDKGSR